MRQTQGFKFLRFVSAFYACLFFSSHSCLDNELELNVRTSRDLPGVYQTNRKNQIYKNFVEESFLAHFLSQQGEVFQHRITDRVQTKENRIQKFNFPTERAELIAKMTGKRDGIFAEGKIPHFFDYFAKNGWAAKTINDRSIISDLASQNTKAPKEVLYKDAAADALAGSAKAAPVRIRTRVLSKELLKDYQTILTLFEDPFRMYETVRFLEIESAQFIAEHFIEPKAGIVNKDMEALTLEALRRRDIAVSSLEDLRQILRSGDAKVTNALMAIVTEALMESRERRHGFDSGEGPKARTWMFVDEGDLTTEQWYSQVLLKPTMFLDLKFRTQTRDPDSTAGQHFTTTHRIQWQLLMIQKELFPDLFSKLPLREVFNSFGDVSYIQNLRHQDAKILALDQESPEAIEHKQWIAKVIATGESSDFPPGLWQTFFDNLKVYNFSRPEVVQMSLHTGEFRFLEVMESLFSPVGPGD